MAIIGSGPAGFYTAGHLLKKMSGTRIDMYEALPVPFGLSRYGVAPDHPEVKECERRFEEIAQSPNFRFIGNTTVGGCPDRPYTANSVPLDTLIQNYDGIVFAYGCFKDKLLGIPGEDLPGVYSAREFVGWYNGSPGYSNMAFDQLRNAEEATIIGHGNVALDIARMLLTNAHALRQTDMANYALDTLSKTNIKRVHIVGRRGPMQVSFTRKELRELRDLKIPKIRFEAPYFPAQLLAGEVPATAARHRHRLMQTLRELHQSPPQEGSKTWSLDFLLTPMAFSGEKSVEKTIFVKNTLENPLDPASKAISTSEIVPIPSQIVFRSIGYLAMPLPGFAEMGIGFDRRKGSILCDEVGRVGCAVSENGFHARYPGLYAAGWVQSGPTGKILDTLMGSNLTAEALLQDWSHGDPFLRHGVTSKPEGWNEVQKYVQLENKKASVVDWKNWQNIDTKERAMGQAEKRPRMKLTSKKRLLEAAVETAYSY